MWKIAVGFVVFAGLSLFVIMKAGDKLDMGGEKHGADAVHAPAAGRSGRRRRSPEAEDPQRLNLPSLPMMDRPSWQHEPPWPWDILSCQ